MGRYLFIAVILVSGGLGLGFHLISGQQPYDLREGDLVFQSGRGGQGRAVMAATDSRWTHVGMMVEVDGVLMVLEAVEPVKYTKLSEFVRRSPKTFTAMRPQLPEGEAPISLDKAFQWGNAQVGKHYDMKFQWSDDTMYCSELIWKIYMQAGVKLCEPRLMSSYDLDDPIVTSLVKSRYGSMNALNVNELVVAPSDLANSPILKLLSVASN